MVPRRLASVVFLALPLRAADPLPGHSYHGEAFDAGPRQAAVHFEGCGKVSFPVTTKSAEARRFFNMGIGQLHGFWYYEAERSFRQVALLDPDCAMAYWGCAMANVNNEKRAAGFVAQAVKRRDGATKREQAWIAALQNFHADPKKDKKQRSMDFIKELEGIVHDHPDDLEAKAFLAWAIWKAKDAGVTMVSREAVDALLQQIFAREPMHPAHHYLIHLWDDSKPIRAVASAAKCGQAAPAIAHMWHMPGHTYSKVNRLDDAEWQQEAATRVDHAYMIRTQILPDQIHNYAHNTEWLIRTLNQLGKAGKAADLARNLVEIPRHPEHNTLDKGSKSAAFGRTRLLETLLKFEQWDPLIALEGSGHLDATSNPSFEAARSRALGVAAFFKEDAPGLERRIAEVSALQNQGTAAKPGAPPAGKPPGATAAGGAGGAKDSPPKRANAAVDNSLAELRALKAIMNGKNADAAKLLEAAGDTPKERLARYHLRMGNKEKAAQLALQLPQDAPGVALRVDILFRCGRVEDAKKHFTALRTLGASLDADVQLARRIDEIAPQLGAAGGWRQPRPPRADSGVRPAMESLGPLLWHPWMAPAFSLPGQSGRPVSLSDYAGRPVVVLFYLGHNCGHCMDQLRAFAGAAADFEKAGVNLLAIGSEPAAELAATSAACGAGGIAPFPLLADPKMSVFRAWRCHDDFEGLGLHGAFLVDGQGRVRWADVGPDPFQNTRFLLEETRRLLRFESAGASR